MMRRPRVAVLYQFFHPDDVVSARHFGDLCTDLVERGWDVEAWPCNRSCHDASQTYPARETWQNIDIRRVWRPALRQSSTLGRIGNMAWMLAGWACRLAPRGPLPDVLLVGTDPALSILIAPLARRFRPNIRIAHWCFDLYPEAPIAAGLFREQSFVVRTLKRLLRKAYQACDLVVDLGACMRRRLDAYDSPRTQTTLVPWALVEPDTVPNADGTTRKELFGSGSLGLLYSGNLGRAHAFSEYVGLARKLRGTGVHFCFAGRGHRAAELRRSLREDDENVTFADFVPEDQLLRRLTAADIQLVSLRPEWTGLVVPSKFFGALAVGRPVLFLGADDSAIAEWIRTHEVGWVLNERSLDSVAEELRELAQAPKRLAELQQGCHRVYHAHFSRRRMMDAWDVELRKLLACG